MPDAGKWEPPVGDATHPCPGDAMTLAASAKRPATVSDDLFAELVYRVAVAEHGVVVEVTSDHAAEPTALVG